MTFLISFDPSFSLYPVLCFIYLGVFQIILKKRFHLVFPEVRNFFKLIVTCKKWSVGCFTLVRYPLFLYNHHYHIPDSNIDRSRKIFWPPTIWYGGKSDFCFSLYFSPPYFTQSQLQPQREADAPTKWPQKYVVNEYTKS